MQKCIYYIFSFMVYPVRTSRCCFYVNDVFFCPSIYYPLTLRQVSCQNKAFSSKAFPSEDKILFSFAVKYKYKQKFIYKHRRNCDSTRSEYPVIILRFYIISYERAEVRNGFFLEEILYCGKGFVSGPLKLATSADALFSKKIFRRTERDMLSSFLFTWGDVGRQRLVSRGKKYENNMVEDSKFIVKKITLYCFCL